MKRFITSINLPPSKRKADYRAEVIDTRHPSDGGPVAVAWFRSIEQAERDAVRRNAGAERSSNRPRTGGSRSEILERLAALPHNSPEYDDAQRELQEIT